MTGRHLVGDNGETLISTTVRPKARVVIPGDLVMPDLDEPYPRFTDQVTQEVQDRFGSAWELEGYEGQPTPMNPDNLDPSLGPDQVRIYVWFTHWIRNIDQKFSINFDPVHRIFGIIKRSSRQ